MTKISLFVLTVLTSLTLVTPVTSQTTKSNQAHLKSTLVTPTVTLSKSTSTIAENGGTATITATLSAATDKDVYVDFSTGGMAKNKTDYHIRFPNYELFKVAAGGHGKGSEANQLLSPSQIFVDKQKNLYVADMGNHRIQKWAYGATEGETVANALFPNGIFVDSLGNVFVPDRTTHSIKKWAPGAATGVTVAGGNGQGSAANQFSYPQQIYIDKQGNMFIVDTGNLRIQKWAPGASSGTTIMGVSGKVLNKSFNPVDLYGDKAGNIYVADNGSKRILRWNAASNTIEELIAQQYGDNPYNFDYITGIYIDDDGNIYIVDPNLIQVAMFKPGSKVAIVFPFRGRDNLFEPTDVFVDKDGNIYCPTTPFDDSDVRRFQYSPQILIPAGQTSSTLTVKGLNDLNDEEDETVVLTPKATNATLNSSDPVSLTITDDDSAPTISFNLNPTTINEEAGAVTVTTSLSRRSAKNIKFKFAAGGTAINGTDYTLSTDSLEIAAGDSLATFKITPINDNLVEVLESIQLSGVPSTNLSTVYPYFTISILSDDKPAVVLSASPVSFSEAGGTSTITATLAAPSGEDIYIDFSLAGTAKNEFDYNLNFSTKGIGKTVAGGNGGGSGANQLATPTDVVITSDGSMYIADMNNQRVQKWLLNATTGTTVAGGNGYGDASNQIIDFNGIAVDNAGNIYIVEQNNHRVQKWAPGANTGVTVAGGNGSGSASNQLWLPQGVDVDNNGNVYVADFDNARIQKWTPGAITGVTVAGGNGQGWEANQFQGPFGVFVDNSGTMFVTDWRNKRIQKWLPNATSGTTVAGAAWGQLYDPQKACVDSAGTIYVADTGGNRVQKWLRNATSAITIAGGIPSGSGPNQLSKPSGVSLDQYGNLYIADRNNNRIQRLQFQPQIFIPAGQTTGTLTFTAINNSIDNVDKTIILTPTKFLSADGTGVQPLNLTISDDDLPPTLNFNAAQTTINEESEGVDVTISLSRRSAKNISFKFSTSGTAIKDTDYILSSDSLVIAAGDSLATVKIIPVNDNIVEILESIQLGISSSVNLSTPYPSLTAYISSEDNPSIILSASATELSEVNGISTIKATLSAPTSREIGVYVTLLGDAQPGTDYLVTYTTNGNASLPKMIIPAGQTTVTDSIKLKAIEDWVNETDESIILSPISANADFPNGALTLTIKENRIQLIQQATPFPALTESAISWGDYDRDGDQDLAIMGTSLATGNVTRIYRNDNGVFVDTQQNFSKLRNGDIQWVDINKDGYLDLMVSGIGVENSVTVRKTVLYINNQGTSFTATSDINVVGLSYTKLAFGDLDNDGDLDLAIIGKNESDQSLFYIYEKLDSQLKYQLISDFDSGINISAITDGDLKVADFDLDGDNDLLFKGGYIKNSYNETGNFDFALSYTNLRYEVSKIFNDASPLTIMGLGMSGSNPYFSANMPLSFLSGNVARKNGAIAAGDFNNDGLNDILVSGENAAATGQSQLYYQKANGSFELSDIALSALRNSTADWVDYDVDGDLDLIMTGIHATNGQTTVLYKNDAGVKHNHAPAAPTNLTVTDLGNGFVKLSWDKPSDDYSTFLGYNIRLGTTPGGTELSNPQSNLQTGSRLITAVPPIYTNSYITQLSPGKYYWSVQAIDQGFQGSPFAGEQIYTLQYDWKLINQRGIINRSISGVEKPKLTLLDIDNDKDLDLILGSDTHRQAYLFDGKIYRSVSLNIGNGGIENLVEGDINNDGLTDLVINSTDKSLKVYFNTGGNFNQVYTSSGTGVINTKLKIVDMDNDGLMDVMTAGITSTDDNGVPKFYRIEWQGTGSNFVFSDLSAQIAPLKYASYDFGDYNKDKKIDFIASGYDENDGLKSILYKNTTIADSTLTLTPTINNFVPVNQGTSDMVDYDGDGDLDLIFTGMIANGPDVFQAYENQLTGEEATFVSHNINIGSLRNAKIRFGDFNGDGYQDIFYTGFRDGAGKVTGLAQYNSISKNYEASTFNYGNLTDAEFVFGDIENDGDLDIILAGNDISNASNKIFRALLNVQNESASVNTNTLANAQGFVSKSEEKKITLAASETFRFNTAPSTPKTKSLKQLTVSNKKILEFAWLAATDDNTPVSGLSYNLRIGTSTTGDQILAANANVAGVRKIAGKGNTEHNLSWNIKMLPNGTYYWSVQAIDASFIGSQFTTPQRFDIINGQLKTYQAPVVSNSTFTISESIAINTQIGKVQATDPESDPLTYQIISGNSSNWFEINASGQITLKSKPAVFPSQIVLEVKVKDGVNEVIATITIKFCESNFTVTQNLVSVTKTYKSTNTIQAANKITGASVVSYEAKNSVLLNPGFMADKGVTFSALVNGGCIN